MGTSYGQHYIYYSEHLNYLGYIWPHVVEFVTGNSLGGFRAIGFFPEELSAKFYSIPTFFPSSYMHCPSYSSGFIHSDYVRWTVKTTKILIVKTSPRKITIRFVLKCSPQKIWIHIKLRKTSKTYIIIH